MKNKIIKVIIEPELKGVWVCYDLNRKWN